MDAVHIIHLTIDRAYQRLVLRAVLQSILFQRALGPIQVHLEDVLGCPVATLADREISAQVNERVEGYWRGCRDARRYEGQVAVVFSHRKSRKTWFTSSEEDVPFEVHLIVLREGSPASPAGAGAGAETRAKEELASALGQILRFCAERTRQVPAISSGVAQVPFPYEIVLDPPEPGEILAGRTGPLSTVAGNNVGNTTVQPADERSTRRSSNPTADPPTAQRGPPPSSPSQSPRDGTRPVNPASAALGYLEQARGGLMAVGGRVGGAVGQWSGKT